MSRPEEPESTEYLTSGADSPVLYALLVKGHGTLEEVPYL